MLTVLDPGLRLRLAPGYAVPPLRGENESLPHRSSLALLALLLAFASSAFAQQPKDPPKDAPKDAPGAADEQKAREAFLAAKLDDALKSLQAAVKANPTLSPPKVTLARWSVETGQGQQARILIEQAAVDDPTHPDVFLTNASFALAEGRITDNGELYPFRSGIGRIVARTPVPVVPLDALFSLPRSVSTAQKALIVRRGGEPYAFVVDRMLGQQEVVVRPLEDPLVKSIGVSGATDLGDGRPILVLDLWEHAWSVYLKPTERAKYLEDFYANVDWTAVAARMG